MTMELGKPAVLAVSMEDAKDTLRIEQDDTSLDGQIAIWIRGITAEAEHSAGLCFMNRPGTVTLDRFPSSIQLAAPTVSVESVTYTDADGAVQTLDPQDYRVDTKTRPGYVFPARGKAWPATYNEPNAVTVNFTAGLGPTIETVPDAATLYILARLLEIFDPAAREFKETATSAFVARLLDGCKVY